MNSAEKILNSTKFGNFNCRILLKSDLSDLSYFLFSQPSVQLKYFNPHKFDEKTLNYLYDNSSFFMIGIFEENKLVGYSFLRFFFNKKAFTGKIVDYNYQGLGIAKFVGKMILQICWENKFRVFCTVSKENVKSLKSLKSFSDLKIVKELSNNFICLEYLKDKNNSIENFNSIMLFILIYGMESLECVDLFNAL